MGEGSRHDIENNSKANVNNNFEVFEKSDELGVVGGLGGGREEKHCNCSCVQDDSIAKNGME